LRKCAVLLFMMLWLPAMGGIAAAAPFTDTIDWNPNITFNDNFTYTHNLNLNPPGLSIQSATLAITHYGNDNYSMYGFGEVWYAYGEDHIYIGKLGDSGHSWRTDSFNLSQAILDGIMGSNPWSLEVRLREDTSGSDYLTLDKSVLSGEYDPVPTPEPATMILLSSGVAGMILNRRRK